MKQVIRVQKHVGLPPPRTRITWASFLGLEEPSLKLLRSAELQRTNSSPISNCRRSKSAIFNSRNINYNIIIIYSNYNINSLLRLSIINLSIYRTSVTYQKSKWKQYRGCCRQPLYCFILTCILVKGWIKGKTVRT